jgi:hypothetical protein
MHMSWAQKARKTRRLAVCATREEELEVHRAALDAPPQRRCLTIQGEQPLP